MKKSLARRTRKYIKDLCSKESGKGPSKVSNWGAESARSSGFSCVFKVHQVGQRRAAEETAFLGPKAPGCRVWSLPQPSRLVAQPLAWPCPGSLLSFTRVSPGKARLARVLSAEPHRPSQNFAWGAWMRTRRGCTSRLCLSLMYSVIYQKRCFKHFQKLTLKKIFTWEAGEMVQHLLFFQRTQVQFPAPT